MAANISRALLEEAGVAPSLVQELTSGNFHEGREALHEYIYSKLIHGDDKGNNPSEPKPGSSVFPNTDMASSYPNPMGGLGSVYNQGSISSHHHPAAESGSNGSHEGEGVKVETNPSPSKGLVSRKSGIPKKNLSHILHDTVQQDGVESSEGSGKIKKNSLLKKKEKTHVCDVCGRGFAEKYTLNRHMLTHTHIKPYSCSKCKMSFSRSDGLAKHMAAGHRRIDAHHCDVCGGTFNSELSFEQHRREYGTTLPFVCNLCMLAFSQCCHLNYHMKSHSLSKMNDSFSYDGKDDKNAIDVSELIPDDFSPPKKDELKMSAQDLIDSFNKSGNKYAGTGHASLDLLDPNVVIKPEIVDFPTCGGVIKNDFASDDNAVHRSGFGNNSFNSATNYPAVTSSASHGTASSRSAQEDGNLTEDNPVSAPSYLQDTSKGLSTSGLSKPFTISESEMTKYYNIKIPNPKFMENSDSHVTSVGEGSLFRCEVCGKGFTRKYHMQRHVKLHIRGPVPRAHLLDWTRRPYACGVCKMGFTRQHHLTRHILIHTGERPHSCHICGRAFRRYTNLSLHIRTVHGSERPFKCHVCGRGFPRLYSLQRHLKLHARNAYTTLNANNDDQLYKGFKAVGTVNVENRKSTIYSSANQSSVQQSTDNVQESLVASNHPADNKQYKQKSTEHVNTLGHLESGGKGSTVNTNQEGYAFLQEENHITFQPRSDQHIQSTDLIRRCQTSQPEEGQKQIGLPQPHVLSLQESENRAQQNRRISTDAEKQQNPIQSPASNEFTSLPHHTDAVRNQIAHHARNVSDFSLQQSMQNTNEQRLISVGSMSSQNLMMLNMAISGSFNELGMPETRKYPQVQRDGGADGFAIHPDGFAIHQQQIKIPLPMMSSLLERPGSRSKINPVGCHDTYQHPSPSYNQPPTPSQIQQRSNMNLTTARKSASPAASLQEHAGYSHNSHLDIAVTQTAINDPSVYSHNHLVNGIPFQVGSLGMYQQLLSESLNQIDIHPHPNASPMPVTSDNGMPY